MAVSALALTPTLLTRCASRVEAEIAVNTINENRLTAELVVTASPFDVYRVTRKSEEFQLREFWSSAPDRSSRIAHRAGSARADFLHDSRQLLEVRSKALAAD